MKRRYLPLSHAELKFPDRETLLLAIREDRLRLRGRRAWPGQNIQPCAPEDISRETIHNSELDIDEDTLVIEDELVPDMGFTDNGCYIDVQVYVEDLDKFLKELRALKRGRKYKYQWVPIKAHARKVARTWTGSQNKFLEHMGSWAADNHRGDGRPSKKSLLCHLGDIFKEAQAR